MTKTDNTTYEVSCAEQMGMSGEFLGPNTFNIVNILQGFSIGDTLTTSSKNIKRVFVLQGIKIGNMLTKSASDDKYSISVLQGISFFAKIINNHRISQLVSQSLSLFDELIQSPTSPLPEPFLIDYNIIIVISLAILTAILIFRNNIREIIKRKQPEIKPVDNDLEKEKVNKEANK